MNRREDEPDRVDWLDLGPDPDEGRPPRDPRRHYLWYAAAAVAVVLALVLTRTQHGTNRSVASPASPSRTGAPSSPSATAPSADPTSAGSFVDPTAAGSFVDPTSAASFVDPPSSAPFPSKSPVRVSNAGSRLLDVPADWELFARAPGLVIRIQLALGRVTSTAVPRVANEIPATFIAGADRVFVRTMDDTPSAVVPDGKSATELPTSFLPGSLLLPGPDPGHLWVDVGGGLALFTLDGRATGASIEIPVSGSVLGPDDAGNVLLSGTGGTYLAKPGAVHRVTGGQLLGHGPTRWLTVECDDSLTCVNVLTDRATGAQHILHTPIDGYLQDVGRISPDGKTVALPRSDGGVTNDGLDLLDLDAGLHNPVEVNVITDSPAGPPFVWSPDSRWLFTVDVGGRIMVVNRATGRATALGVQLPPVTQLVFRHRTG